MNYTTVEQLPGLMQTFLTGRWRRRRRRASASRRRSTPRRSWRSDANERSVLTASRASSSRQRSSSSTSSTGSFSARSWTPSSGRPWAGRINRDQTTFSRTTLFHWRPFHWNEVANKVSQDKQFVWPKVTWPNGLKTMNRNRTARTAVLILWPTDASIDVFDCIKWSMK